MRIAPLRPTLSTIIILLIALCPGRRVSAQDGIPESIHYQGSLADASGTPIDGTRNLSFKLFDAASGGNEVWAEDQTNVAVSGGLFDIDLGSVSPFSAAGVDFSRELWLEVTVGTETLTPRVRLTAVPYAFKTKGASSGSTDPAFTVNNTGGGDGIVVDAGDEGIVVDSDGPGVQVDSGDDGVLVRLAGDAGVQVGIASDDGLRVILAGSPSKVNTSSFPNGVEVRGAEGHGVYVGHSGSDAIRVEEAGLPSATISNSGSNGVEIQGAEDHGFVVGRADGSGLVVASAGSNGVSISDAGGNGILVRNAGGDGINVDYAGGNGAEITNDSGTYSTMALRNENSSGNLITAYSGTGPGAEHTVNNRGHAFNAFGAGTPLAYGLVAADGSVQFATDNVTQVDFVTNDPLTIANEAQYNITISDSEGYGLIPVATFAGTALLTSNGLVRDQDRGTPIIVAEDSGSGIAVKVRNSARKSTVDTTPNQSPFYFVVFANYR